jgi:hypothetical protein
LIPFWHFLMDNAAARGHPLDLPGRNSTAVPEAIAMLDRSRQDIGNGFDTPVRVPWKTGEIIVGNVVAKIVEQQKGIEVGGVAEPERASQMDARAF